MRAATHDTGWLISADGALMGICLGHDFCAEHEWGIAPLRAALGLPSAATPIGLEDRTIKALPAKAMLEEYLYKPRDKRRKGVPAAAMLVHAYDYDTSGSVKERLRNPALNFSTDAGDRWYVADRHDLRCAWDSKEFGIHVRGADNIARLKVLWDAFQRHDIALADPGGMGFKRNGLSFVIASAVPETDKQFVRDKDLARKRLEDAVAASGIHRELESAGKRWHALAPDWYDRENESGLMFFLNPWEQSKFEFGWFTLDELRQWARNTGPVITDAALAAYENRHPDCKIEIRNMLSAAGVSLRILPVLAKTSDGQIGVRIHVAPGEQKLPSGIYEIESLTKTLLAMNKATV